jgi:WD40 repeat protein
LTGLEEVWTVAFAPGGRRFLTATLLGRVQVWDLRTGREVARLAGPFTPTALAVRADGGLLAVAFGGHSRGGIELYDLARQRLVRTFASHAALVTQLAFSPDGSRLASASGDKSVKVWDVASGRELLALAGHGQVNTVAFSPDGNTLASGGQDSSVRLWAGRPGREVFTWRSNRIALGLALSPDGKRLAASLGMGRVHVLDLENGRHVLSVGDGEGPLVTGALAFSPDGTVLATARGQPGQIGEVLLRDAATGVLRQHLRGHRDAVLSLAFRPDSERLASASHDRTVKVWDVGSGRELRTLGHASRVHGVAYSPDGQRLASACGDGLLRVWEADTGKELLRLPGPRGAPGTVLLGPDPWSALLNLRINTASLGAVAFSPDGRFLAAGSLAVLDANNRVLVWDSHSGKQVKSLRGHTGFVYGVAFSPDGRFLASCGADRTVRLWERGTGREVLKLTGHDAPILRVAFSPDGKRVASASFDGSVRVWDVTRPAQAGP